MKPHDPEPSSQPAPPRALAVRGSGAPAKSGGEIIEVEVVPVRTLGKPAPVETRKYPVEQQSSDVEAFVPATPAQRCAVYGSVAVFVTTAVYWLAGLFVSEVDNYSLSSLIFAACLATATAVALGGWIWRGIEIHRTRELDNKVRGRMNK